MIQNGLLKIVMWAIVPISLTLIFLITVDSHQPGAWLNLLFVWIAYLTATCACVISVGRLGVLEWTVYMCAIVYFIVEMLLAITFLYIYDDVPKWAYATQMLLFTVFVLLAGALYISSQKTVSQIELQKAETNVINQWKLKVNLAKAQDPSEELSQLLALLHVTPTQGIDETRDIENEISLLMENLPHEQENITKKIKERNIILKNNH